jgi:hypothetical protein
MEKREDRLVNLFAMLLKALVVRSTTQKDKAFPQSQESYMGLALLGDTLLSLAWNGQVIVLAIEGIVAHGQGGNQGKLLVL